MTFGSCVTTIAEDITTHPDGDHSGGGGDGGGDGTTGCTTIEQSFPDNPSGLGAGPGGIGAWTVTQGFGSVSGGVGTVVNDVGPGFGHPAAYLDYAEPLCGPWAIRWDFSYSGGFSGLVHIGAATYVATAFSTGIQLQVGSSWPYIGPDTITFDAALPTADTGSGTAQLRSNSAGEVWGRISRGGTDSGWHLIGFTGGALSGIAVEGIDGAFDFEASIGISSLVIQYSDCDDAACSAGETGVGCSMVVVDDAARSNPVAWGVASGGLTWSVFTGPFSGDIAYSVDGNSLVITQPTADDGPGQGALEIGDRTGADFDLTLRDCSLSDRGSIVIDTNHFIPDWLWAVTGDGLLSVSTASGDNDNIATGLTLDDGTLFNVRAFIPADRSRIDGWLWLSGDDMPADPTVSATASDPSEGNPIESILITLIATFTTVFPLVMKVGQVEEGVCADAGGGGGGDDGTGDGDGTGPTPDPRGEVRATGFGS